MRAIKKEKNRGNFTGVPADINCQRNRSEVITAIVIIIERHTKKKKTPVVGLRASSYCVRKVFMYW